VIAHRLSLTPEAQMQGLRTTDIVEDLLRLVSVPTAKPSA
jgi:MoxR-like ATPase